MATFPVCLFVHVWPFVYVYRAQHGGAKILTALSPAHYAALVQHLSTPMQTLHVQNPKSLTPSTSFVRLPLHEASKADHLLFPIVQFGPRQSGA
jgi:hypothetical protein